MADQGIRTSARHGALLAERRRLIEARRESAARELRHLREEFDRSDLMDGDHPAGPGHDLERVMALDRDLLDELVAVDEALWRLELSEYGRCQSCGEDLPLERLDVRPHARDCVPCARAAERAVA